MKNAIIRVLNMSITSELFSKITSIVQILMAIQKFLYENFSILF